MVWTCRESSREGVESSKFLAGCNPWATPAPSSPETFGQVAVNRRERVCADVHFRHLSGVVEGMFSRHERLHDGVGNKTVVEPRGLDQVGGGERVGGSSCREPRTISIR